MRDIVVAHHFEAGIPEISRSETNVVFEIEQAHNIHKAMEIVPHTFQMLEYDGRLYRHLATPEWIDDETKDAFAHEWTSGFYPFARSISVIPNKVLRNPVASALQKQIGWVLQADSTHRDRREHTWPHPYPGSTKRWGLTDTLNDQLFTNVSTELSEIDGDAVARSTRDFAHQAGKLLVVDGDLWMESPPPAICVHYTDGFVVIDIAPVHEGPTPQPSTVYFPLDRRGEAERYADVLADTCAGQYGKRKISDGMVPFSESGSELLAFNPEEVELRNICHNLVVSNERSLRATNPDHDAGFLTDAARQEHDVAFAKALDADFVRGEYHDLSGHFDMAATLWKKCRRPAYQFDLPANRKGGHLHGDRKRTGDLMLARGYQMLENAPITLLTQSPALGFKA
ncbi:hypothetical protein OIU34_19725 [Pararhizobium sp. BT-229]|uniref:hypothetical protein n=1 Tax=Pararhizobium sp. BT-229 TaxID=2986923 RepID=UPI0021F7BFEA|nr:hypothetical protein [Pararhizobium sp. BT-229]MCV9964115.1 hypothetical protein [Pararhizobium sp. BT-229]